MICKSIWGGVWGREEETAKTPESKLPYITIIACQTACGGGGDVLDLGVQPGTYRNEGAS